MALVEGAGPVGRFGRQSYSTPKVVPGAALPWHRLGRVGGLLFWIWIITGFPVIYRYNRIPLIGILSRYSILIYFGSFLGFLINISNNK